MESRKGRSVSPGQRVKVYKNLHRDCFSIVDPKTRLVLGYAKTVLLTDCVFSVSQKGRARVLEKRRKEVHAHVIGAYQGANLAHPESLSACVRYNPYETAHFVLRDTGGAIHKSPLAFCSEDRVWV